MEFGVWSLELQNSKWSFGVGQTPTDLYSEGIDVERGVTQGVIDSLIIFNILVDAVVRKFLEDTTNGKSNSSFYADDGRIENEDS